MMRYPVLIEEGTEAEAFGVVFPDLPGCYSAGDTLDDALEAAKEAAAAWIDTALDDGTAIPAPSPLDDVRRLPDYKGWVVALIELDPALFDDSIERVNITLPKRVLRRLDDLAASRHQSRGAFISDLTMITGEPKVSDDQGISTEMIALIAANANLTKEQKESFIADYTEVKRATKMASAWKAGKGRKSR